MPTSIQVSLERQLADASPREIVQLLFDFMRQHGQSRYDEAVTQIEHALQCAQLAKNELGSDAAVTAALLHDIGHLLLNEHDATKEFLKEDLNHEDVAVAVLSPYFPPEVTEPIRLHVAAKRYLCTVEPAYYETLSLASKRSYEVQGGKLSAAELAEFQANPYLDIAVQIRRYDDLGKNPDLKTPDLEAYQVQVQNSLRPAAPQEQTS